jgi:DNA-binding FrmR family transcriptional regulator
MRQVYWDSEDMLRRLRRIEGQVRGIQAMVQREETCQDILVQVAAIEGAIGQVARIVSACSVVEALSSVAGVPSDPDAVRAALNQLLR